MRFTLLNNRICGRREKRADELGIMDNSGHIQPEILHVTFLFFCIFFVFLLNSILRIGF